MGFIETDRIIFFRFSPACYDDITTNIQLEYLIATTDEGDEKDIKL